MGYAVMAYRVDLAALEQRIGIKDKARRMEVRRALMQSFTGQRMGDRRGFSIAVSNLLLGPPYAANYTPEASELGYACQALCDAFGTSLFNNPVSPFHGRFLDDVEAHLTELGVPMVRKLVYGSRPLGLPSPEDFPVVGHLTQPEVADLAGRFEPLDTTTATPALGAMEAGLRRSVLEAAEMFRAWILEARDHTQGIVSFHY